MADECEERALNIAAKLDSVVGAFFCKAANIIVQSRQNAALGRKLNMWFNVDSHDSEAFREELEGWRRVNCIAAIKPLVIEVYALIRDLTPNQTLVVVDTDGRRHDLGITQGELALERWQIDWVPHGQLRDRPDPSASYKKAVVVFRSLYSIARLLPAWKLKQRLSKSRTPGLKIGLRLRSGSGLHEAIKLDEAVPTLAEISRYELHTVDTAAGGLRLRVQYRAECDLRIDDAEALLSSHFLRHDGVMPRKGSLPTELRAHAKAEDQPRYASVRTSSSIKRRTSVIQPFKTPSLSASPAPQISRTPSSASIERVAAIRGAIRSATPVSAAERPGPSALRRYSSSFGQRSGSFSSRRRPSSNAPEISLSREASSTSLERHFRPPPEDDEELSAFVSMLDERPVLGGRQAQRTVDELRKYQQLRDSHETLADSISQSSNTRKLAEDRKTLTQSFSPAKSASPHAPIVPSRLSGSHPVTSARPVSRLSLTADAQRGPADDDDLFFAMSDLHMKP
ncbi:autophagy protein 13 [Savitreella phatthalungensis]